MSKQVKFGLGASSLTPALSWGCPCLCSLQLQCQPPSWTPAFSALPLSGNLVMVALNSKWNGFFWSHLRQTVSLKKHLENKALTQSAGSTIAFTRTGQETFHEWIAPWDPSAGGKGGPEPQCSQLPLETRMKKQWFLHSFWCSKRGPDYEARKAWNSNFFHRVLLGLLLHNFFPSFSFQLCNLSRWHYCQG